MLQKLGTIRNPFGFFGILEQHFQIYCNSKLTGETLDRVQDAFFGKLEGSSTNLHSQTHVFNWHVRKCARSTSQR